MSEYSIATHGLPQATVAALRSMLNMLEPMLGKRWCVRDAMPADVLIAPVEALARLPQVSRPGKLPVFVGVGDENARLPIVSVILKRPVTVSGLMEALQVAAGLIERIHAPEAALHTIPLLEQFGHAKKFATTTLDKRVRTTLRAATFRLLQSPAAVTLVDEQRQTIYSVLPGIGYTSRLTAAVLAERLRQNAPSILLELDEKERHALSKARHFQPLEDLEWAFWFSARAPWLRTELSAEAVYKLTRWPDFVRLAHTHTEVRLASFLMSQPMTVQTLCERTGASEERAMNFLNGVYALGLLTDGGVTEPHQNEHGAFKGPFGLAGLIAQVRKKFGFDRMQARDVADAGPHAMP